MNLEKILEYAVAVLQMVPRWIATGVNVAARMDAETAKIEAWKAAGTDPTQADFDELNASQAPKEAALQSDDDGA